MTSGMTSAQPEWARGTIGRRISRPTSSRPKPARMMSAARRFPARFPAISATREHAERQRGERQARLHGVVLEHHLQEDRQGDHRAAEGDLLGHLTGDAEPEVLGGEQRRVDQGRLAGAMAAHQPPGEQSEADRTDGDQRDDRFTALLPDEDAEHDAAHADDRQDGPDDVDATVAGELHVAHQSDAREHDRDHDGLEEEGDPPRQVGGDEAADERSHGGGDRRRGADQGIDPPLGVTLEVAVDERLHRREQERCAQPAEDRPADDDREEVLGHRHRQRADGVAEQAEDVRPLATEQVADLAADQDERGRDQRLQGDGRLHAAHGRVEVLDDRRDRHVHQRGVDDEHEHRHRQQDGESLAPGVVARPRRTAPVPVRSSSAASSGDVRSRAAGPSPPRTRRR